LEELLWVRLQEDTALIEVQEFLAVEQARCLLCVEVPVLIFVLFE